FNSAVGYNIGHNLSDVTYPIVVGGLADVERLVEYCIYRGAESCHEGSGDVFDVHDRAPRRAVRLKQDFAPRYRPGDQIVQDDVEPHPRREPVSGRGSKIYWTKIRAGECGNVPLRPDFRLAI